MKKKVLIILGIILAIILIAFLGILVYLHVVFKSNMPVVAYHNVMDSVSVDTDISTKKFEKEMKWLKKNKFKVLTMDEFYKWKTKDEKFSYKKVVITFDDGKQGVYDNAIPILEKYELPATIFIIDSRVGTEGYLTQEQIDDILENHPLITLESHSNDLHIDEKAKSNDYNIYYDDLGISKENGYNYFAYPYGYANDNYIKALKDNDYKLAFKFSPSKWVNINDDNYLLGRVPIYDSTSMIKFKLKVLLKK